MYPQVLNTVNKNATDKVSDYLKSESMLLQNILKNPMKLHGFPILKVLLYLSLNTHNVGFDLLNQWLTHVDSIWLKPSQSEAILYMLNRVLKIKELSARVSSPPLFHIFLSSHFSHSQTILLWFFFAPKKHLTSRLVVSTIDYFKPLSLQERSCPVQFAGVNKTNVSLLHW